MMSGVSDPREVSIHKVDDGFVLAVDGCWWEGVYDTREEALQVALGVLPEKVRATSPT